MKNLITYLITNIVDNTEEIDIVEEADDTSVRITIHVATSDIGKVIGKSGKTIRAIREMARILAVKQGKYVDVQIAEGE